jgi:hypothetical protein
MSFRRSLGSLVLALLVAASGPPASALADVTTVTTMTFNQLGYGDRTMRGAFATAEYFLPLPSAGQTVSGAKLDVDVSHSPMLSPDRSTLTVIVDGIAVFSTFLSADTVSHGTVSIELPPLASATATGYSVQLLFFMRLSHDVCEDPNNPALWASVYGKSLLTLPPEVVASRDLNAVTNYLTPSAKRPVRIALRDQPAKSEIATAGRVAFTLGRWAATTQSDPRLAASPSSGEAATVDVRTASDSPPGDGLLSITPEGPPQVSVKGRDEQELMLAASGLATPQLLQGLQVAVNAQSLATPNPASAPWSAGAASFEQLGFSDQRVAGPGLHTISLVSQRPPGWSLRTGAALDLVIHASPALRADTSWMTATVDGREVGSQRLQPGVQPHHYRFNLPYDLLNTRLDTSPIRDLALDLRFDLELPQVGCTPIPYDSAWADVLTTSAWLLPHDTRSGLELGTFPYPFVAPNAPGSAIVLPSNPTPEDLAAGLQVAAAAGRWVGVAATPPLLVRASQLSASQRHDFNLILIGRADRDLGKVIPTAAQAHIRPAGRGVSVAVLAEAESPWNRDRTVLVLHSIGGSGLLLASQAMASVSDSDKVHGREVAVAGRINPQTLLPAKPPGQPPAELAPTAEPGVLERIPPWALPSAVLLVTLLAAAVVAVRIRWWPRMRNSK